MGGQYLSTRLCASIGHLALTAPTSLDGFLITSARENVPPAISTSLHDN